MSANAASSARPLFYSLNPFLPAQGADDLTLRRAALVSRATLSAGRGGQAPRGQAGERPLRILRTTGIIKEWRLTKVVVDTFSIIITSLCCQITNK